jgi:hypothetical protein
MSALRRIKKVKEGYEVTVSCTNKPMLTAFYRTYEQCEKFADNYFLDYFGVALKSVHHPEGDGVVPEGLNPDSLETIEIEIPMNERLKELAEQAGLSREFSVSGLWLADDQELERFADLVRQDYLRELRDLTPVGYMDSKGVLFNKTTHPQLNTALYALDEVKHESD